MATSNPNTDMLIAAESSVKIAQQQLNRSLDYSEYSLEDFDILFEFIKAQFSKLDAEGKLKGENLQRASISLGGYLGEVIRRKHGGTWIAKTSAIKTLIIDGQEYSPVLYIYQRLTNSQEMALKTYWANLEEKIYTKRVTVDEETNNTIYPQKAKKDKGSFILGVAIFIGVCIFMMVAVAIYSNIRTTNEFKTKYNSFVMEADKLDVMTEQGVSYSEFKTQLVEVKSTYSQIDYWPSSYKSEKLAFDKAIDGWDLILDVWKVLLDDPSDFYLPQNDRILKDVSGYLGTEVEIIFLVGRTNTYIEKLMGQASNYFEAGKAGIK